MRVVLSQKIIIKVVFNPLNNTTRKRHFVYFTDYKINKVKL